MAAVNGKREIDEKEYKNPCTDCHDNKIEQNDLEELKAVKINKINRKIKTLRKKAKENKKSDEKDWKSTYLEWIAVLPVGGFQLLADVLVKNIWKSLAILLLGIFILKKIEHIIEKISKKSIGKWKNRILNCEIIIHFKNEKIRKGIFQEDIGFTQYEIECQKERKAASWESIQDLFAFQNRVKRIVRRAIGLAVFVVGLNVAIVGFNNLDASETIEQGDNMANKDNADSYKAEQKQKGKTEERTEVIAEEETNEEEEVDETEEAFNLLWNLYLSDLQMDEIVSPENALSEAKNFCVQWIDNEHFKEIDRWLYTDMEVYDLESFRNVTLKERNLSINDNANGSILLKLGKTYSSSIDEFLESCGGVNITERTIGIACLRGTDIYMSALRHGVSRKSVKEECYKGAALLLREFADEVYEKQKYRELDKLQKEEQSAKEFVLYTYSAVCYENAAEYGDALCKKEAEKMKAAAKDNWASFKNWVP